MKLKKFEELLIGRGFTAAEAEEFLAGVQKEIAFYRRCAEKLRLEELERVRVPIDFPDVWGEVGVLPFTFDE